jgi:transposase
MSKGERRVFSREFKLAAVGRMLAGESVAALGRELEVASGNLYKWCQHFRLGGAEALRSACRPRKGFGVLDLEAPGDLAGARRRIGARRDRRLHRGGLQPPAPALGPGLSAARRVRGEPAVAPGAAAPRGHAGRASNGRSGPGMRSALVHQGDGFEPPLHTSMEDSPTAVSCFVSHVRGAPHGRPVFRPRCGKGRPWPGMTRSSTPAAKLRETLGKISLERSTWMAGSKPCHDEDGRAITLSCGRTN